MTTPHITRLLKELENIATADFKKWSVPHATAADFVTWAQSRATFAINEVKAAIAQELAEQATQDQFISADDALKLGEDGAEWTIEDIGGWIKCGKGCKYKEKLFDQVVKYRAIRKEVPAEPHAELRALYAQQVKNGTLGDFVWEFEDSSGWNLCYPQPVFRPFLQYRCTPKPAKVVAWTGSRDDVMALLRELGFIHKDDEGAV